MQQQQPIINLQIPADALQHLLDVMGELPTKFRLDPIRESFAAQAQEQIRKMQVDQLTAGAAADAAAKDPAANDGKVEVPSLSEVVAASKVLKKPRPQRKK